MNNFAVTLSCLNHVGMFELFSLYFRELFRPDHMVRFKFKFF